MLPPPPENFNFYTKSLLIQLKITLFFILGISYFHSTAQTNFQSDLLRNSQYYDSLISVRGIDSMQGTGYTQYQRWFRYWAPKLLPDKDYSDYQSDLLEYAQQYSAPISSIAGNINWNLVGPDGEGEYMGDKYTGQIHYIYRKGQTLFACSPVGGLFISNDDGDNWENAGTDKGLPRSGVSSVVVDKYNYWYVTTGNGESYLGNFIWQQSIGVYRSKDQGASWNLIGLDKYKPYSAPEFTIQNMRKVVDISPINSNSTSLIVATTHGLFRINNANQSSPNISRLIDNEFYDIEPDLGNPDYFYASGSGTTGVYKINRTNNTYTNLGFPFQEVNIPTSQILNQRITIETTITDADYLYAIYTIRIKDQKDKSFLYIYNNEQWTLRGALPQSLNGEAFSGYARSLGWDMGHINEETVLIGSNVSPYYLVSNCNGPGELTSIDLDYPNEKPHDDCHFILLEGDNKIWAGTDGGVVHGTITGQAIDWQIKNKGLGVATIEHMDAIFSSNKSFVTSGQFDCGSFVYETNDEINWTDTYICEGDGYKTLIPNENLFFVSGQNGWIKKSENGNIVKLPQETTPQVDDSCDPIEPPVNIYYANWNTYFDYFNNYLYMTGQKEIRRLNLSTNDWDDWSSFEDDPNMGCAKSGTWEIAVTGNSSNTMYVSTYGGSNYSYFQIYKSNGGGAQQGAWQLITKDANVEDGFINVMEPGLGSDSENKLYVAIKDKIYYVDCTDMGHAVWTPINYGLNVGTINDIKLESGRVWIGTERGLYYLDNGTTTWINYTSDLPNAAVTSIKIAQNYRIYVGTYGRGVWYASAPGCGSGLVHQLETNETIYSPITNIFYGDVIIPPGLTLTVEGTLKMGAGCRIIVERGGKLVVDGGIITNACPDMWKGIEVWGTGWQEQSAPYQGIVDLKNDALIEHAEIAISTIKIDENKPGGYDSDYSGGMIFANNTVFSDNAQDIKFYEYPFSSVGMVTPDYPSSSIFTKCTFKSSDDLYFFNKTEFRKHVQLTGIKGVTFEGCHFEENTTIQTNETVYGISSRDAGFNVIADSTEFGAPVFGSFTNLDYGIYSTFSSYLLKAIKIDQTEFIDNWKGIYLSAVNDAIITRNIFDEKPDISLCGLYLDNCTGYQVEENEFFSKFGVFSHDYFKTIGIVINNSGYENNFIYNNIFHNLPSATIAQGINRSSKNNTGLQIKCNNYWDNFTDIAVTYSEPNSNNGIAAEQGSSVNDITAPAGNRFSRSGEWQYSDFDNQGGNVNYWLPTFGVVLINWRLYPYYKNNVNTIYGPVAQWDSINGCPSNLSQYSIVELKSLVDVSLTSLEVYSDSLNTLVDAGNTTSLALDVATSIPPETMQIRGDLLNASPYLSDTVMVSAIEKEDVLPNSILTEVLTSNPQSAKSEKVLNKLSERQTPPSENQMALIHVNDTILGHKEKLESGRAHYSSLQHQAVGQLVRYYMADSLQEGIADSIEQALAFIQSPASMYNQAFCRYNKGDSLGVFNMLDNIPSEFELTQSEADLNSDYEDYFGLLLQLKSDNKSISELDSLQKGLLYTILQNGNNNLQAYCRNILIQVDSLAYSEPYLFPDLDEDKSSEVIYPGMAFNSDIIENNQFFKLYPNPAKEYITLEYSLETETGTFEIFTINSIRKQSFSLSNRQGIKTIDLRGLENGVYLIKLSSKGKLLQTERFVKQ
ncbi:MAG TPA: T9SS type A sorting domain-containing protein [Bacteroidales bacterium]